MDEKRMPALFVGHGSPLMALEDSDITRELARIGAEVRGCFGMPRAIVMVSAHWYTKGSRVQTAALPRQVYDMYGFPPELYEVRYPAAGSPSVGKRIVELLGPRARVDDSWGIDHGAWSVLVHLFPEADIPVVQLSVDAAITFSEAYELGRVLAVLRDEGCLIIGSGNIVHNLSRVDWSCPGGFPEALSFDGFVVERVLARDDAAVIACDEHPQADFALPSPDHFLPLLYVLGATAGERPRVFNNVCDLGAISMTGFAFGLDNVVE